MAQAPFPRFYPKDRSEWWTTFADWLWVNVILGALALILSGVMLAVSTDPKKLPADMALSLIVLAMTIAANGMDALKEYRTDDGRVGGQGLRRWFFLLMFVGCVLAVLSTPSDLLHLERINQTAIGVLCLLLLVVIAGFGFRAHCLGLRTRDSEVDRVIRLAFDKFDDDPEYLQLFRAREQRLQTALTAAPDTYNGAAL
jgi:hypothetical protein